MAWKSFFNFIVIWVCIITDLLSVVLLREPGWIQILVETLAMFSSRWVLFPQPSDFLMNVIPWRWDTRNWEKALSLHTKKYLTIRNKAEEIWWKVSEMTEKAPLVLHRCDCMGRVHAGVTSVREIRTEERASRLRFITHRPEGNAQTHTHIQAGGVWSLQRFRFETGEAYI